MNRDCIAYDAGIPVLGNIEDFDRVMQTHGINEVIFALSEGSPVDLKKYLNIDNWRFWHDLAILWKTVWVVSAGKGAK